MERGPVVHYGTCPPDWSLGVHQVGHEACEPGHNWQGVRDHYLLHYVRSGHGEVVVGRDRVTLERGDAFLYAPGDYLNYTADDTDPWHYLWVGFRGLHAADLISPLQPARGGTVFKMPYTQRIERILSSMLDAGAQRVPGSDLRLIGLLYELLAELVAIRSSEPQVRLTAADLVREAQRFIEQNYQRPIDVGDVVRHIGVDRSHFSRVFSEQCGETLRTFLIRTRMEHARHLLESSRLAVRAIAASVGYRNYTSFERRYRESFGCSPSDDRRRSRSDASSIR